MHWSMTILSQRYGSARIKALLCCSSRDRQEDKEFYQAKTVKTHSNNLVVHTHVQLLKINKKTQNTSPAHTLFHME